MTTVASGGVSILPYEIVTSDNYPNDAITFDLQTRFEETSSIKLFTVTNAVVRDFADFVEITPSSTTPEQYSVLMVSPIYRHDIESSVIDTTFTELING